MKKKQFLAFAMFCLLFALAAHGCKTEPDDPGDPVGTVILRDVPKEYYKVYVNISNSQVQTEKHVAQGTALVEDGEGSGSTRTVTVTLYEPVAGDDWYQKDPDSHGTAEWTGRASYFSIMYAKKDVRKSKKNEDVRAFGGLGFSSKSNNRKWNEGFDLSTYDNGSKFELLFNDVISKDTDGTTGTSITLTN